MRVIEREFKPNPDYFTENYDPNLNCVLFFKGSDLAFDSVEQIKADMLAHAQKHGAQIKGDFIVLVEKAKVDEGKLGLKVILPIDKRIPAFRSFKFRDKYKLEGCIMSKYQGFFLKPDVLYRQMETEAKNALRARELAEEEEFNRN